MTHKLKVGTIVFFALLLFLFSATYVRANPLVTVTPVSYMMDVGQSQTFTAHPSFGSGSYTVFQWYVGSSLVQNGSVSTYVFTPSSSGFYSITVNVTDSKNAVSDPSSRAVVTVNPALTATVSPSSWTMDVGQSETFRVSASEGTYPVSYQWYLNDSAVPGATGASYLFEPSVSGSPSIYCNVTYGASSPFTVKSNTPNVTVNEGLSVNVSPSAWSMDVDQSETFTATASGGSGALTYQWYLLGASIFGATAPTYTYATATLGSPTIYCRVTDQASNHETVQSNSVLVIVNSEIVAPTISASAITVDQSQTSSLTLTLISTGTSPYSYQWLEQVPGEESYVAVNDATSSSYSFATSTSTDIGTYSFELQVTDSTSSAVISGAIAITVNGAPIVSLSPDSYSTNLGQSGTFTASASGGSGTYTSYQWYVGYDEVQSGISNSFTFSSSYAGSYSITVTVTDSLGLNSDSSSPTYVTVNQATATASFNSSSYTITAGNAVAPSVTITGIEATTPPTGTVTFYYSTDGGATWTQLGAEIAISGSGETANATASQGYGPTSAASSYEFGATYSGDSNYNAITAKITAPLTVNAASLSQITVSLSSTSVTAGTTVTFSALGTDLYRNPITIAPSWSVSPVGAISGTSVNENSAGAYTVTATVGTLSAQASFEVLPTGLSTITVSVSSSNVFAGNVVTLTAVGYDSSGNGLGPQSVTFTVNGSSVSGASVTETLAGTYTVSVTTSGVKIKPAIFQVTPSDLDHIAINPSSSTISAGEFQAYAVVAYDTYGNSLGDVTSTTTFTAPGASVSGNTITSTTSGVFTVTATYNGKSAAATLTLNAPSSQSTNPSGATTPKPIVFSVTFTEIGLPREQTWNVTFRGVTESSNQNTMTFNGIQAGTYPWTTPAVSFAEDNRLMPLEVSGEIEVPITTAKSITYIPQYYLTVTSTYGNTTGTGWYDARTTATFSVTSPYLNSGKNYIFDKWIGTGVGSCTNSTNPQTVTMNNPITETATWKTASSISLYLVGLVTIVLFAVIFTSTLMLSWLKQNRKKTDDNASPASTATTIDLYKEGQPKSASQLETKDAIINPEEKQQTTVLTPPPAIAAVSTVQEDIKQESSDVEKQAPKQNDDLLSEKKPAPMALTTKTKKKRRRRTAKKTAKVSKANAQTKPQLAASKAEKSKLPEIETQPKPRPATVKEEEPKPARAKKQRKPPATSKKTKKKRADNNSKRNPPRRQ